MPILALAQACSVSSENGEKKAENELAGRSAVFERLGSAIPRLAELKARGRTPIQDGTDRLQFSESGNLGVTLSTKATITRVARRRDVDSHLTFRENGLESTARVISNVAMRPDVFASTDGFYTVSGDTVDASYVLRSSAAPRSFSFSVQRGPALTKGRQLADGTIVWNNVQGEPAFRMPLPAAVDSAAHPITLQMTLDGDNIQIALDELAQAIQFPVLLDPILEQVVWTNVTPNLPLARYQHAASSALLGGAPYHVANTPVAFGGSGVTGALGDTLTWDSNTGSWLVAVAGPQPPFIPSPTARRAHAMAPVVSPARSVLLFGGFGARTLTGDGGISSPTSFLSDTWLWSTASRSWSGLSPASAPAGRYGHAMAFDPATGSTLLFGGIGATGDLGDTWRWTGLDWSQVSPASSPSPRHGHAMALEENTQRVFLVGGGQATAPRRLADTWMWDGTTWTHVADGPFSGRDGHMLAFSNGYLYLVGGETALGPSSEVWRLSVSGTPPTYRWESAPANGVLSARSYGTLNSLQGQGLAAFGGLSNGQRLSETLWLDSGTWRTLATRTHPAAREGSALAEVSAGRVMMVGGLVANSPTSDIWRWNGVLWDMFAPPSAFTPRFRHVVARNPKVDEIFVHGGATPTATLSDLWSVSSTGAATLLSMSGPARYAHAADWDADRGRLVLFGGANTGNPTNDTFEWDGAAWAQRTPTGSIPSPRQGHAMAFHEGLRESVLIGGCGPDPMADVWTWDGTRWQELRPVSELNEEMFFPRCGHSVTAAAGGRLVVTGGFNLAGPVDDAWELYLAGSTWTWRQVVPTIRPPVRDFAAFGYDTARRKAVLVEGRGATGDYADTWEYQAWGNQCSAQEDCDTGFCVDGVCCNTACGGGSTTDCQVCSQALGASKDGTCTLRPSGALCRSSMGTCDAAETCNGTSAACPADMPQPDGTSCNDGNSCTQTDKCQAGACTGTNPVTCATPDQCHIVGTCNQTTGICSAPAAKANNTSCDDGDACTLVDTCQTGICTSSGRVACPGADQCHTPGTCDKSTGLCSLPIRPDNTPCNDNNGCTKSDVCRAGICTGTNPVTCTALDQCHDVGLCDTGTGLCSNPAKANGTVCPSGDGSACTRTDTCVAGVCTGSNPVTCAAPDQCHIIGSCNPSTGVCSAQSPKAEGTPCDDGSPCTTADTCTPAGLCQGKPVGCDDANACTTDSCAVVLSKGTYVAQCQHTAVRDGQSCNDANPCTQTDTCMTGVCTGGNPVQCAAPDPCHMAGSCSASTGLCTYPNKSDGTGCNDGNVCTTSDVCTGGVCGGTQMNCNDANPCTNDSCYPLSINGGAPFASCLHLPINCDDANACTIDSCTVKTSKAGTYGQCVHAAVASGTSCEDGDVCTGIDKCNANGQCVHAGSTCSIAPVPVCKQVAPCPSSNCFTPSPANTSCACSSIQCPTGKCDGIGNCSCPTTCGPVVTF